MKVNYFAVYRLVFNRTLSIHANPWIPVHTVQMWEQLIILVTKKLYTRSDYYSNICNTPLSGLSWKTEICRSEEIRGDAFSIRPVFASFAFNPGCLSHLVIASRDFSISRTSCCRSLFHLTIIIFAWQGAGRGQTISKLVWRHFWMPRKVFKDWKLSVKINFR